MRRAWNSIGLRSGSLCRMRFPRNIALAAAVFSTAVSPLYAATLEVGPGKAFLLPSAAAVAARDGDRVLIAAGTYHDCAVWRANNLLIAGAGMDATRITGSVCESKGLFVTNGAAITVRDLTLAEARNADDNGAGIRAQGGDLTVERVRFLANQNGILTAPNPTATLAVRDSVFERNGTCAGPAGCAHGIYANNLALFRVERSRFAGTREGHHIKSRALRTEILDTDFVDGSDGTASYAIDIPNGGALVVRGCRIEKGPHSQNRKAAIAVGQEGVKHPTPEIVVETTEFRAAAGMTPYLVLNATATDAELRRNSLQGDARALSGDGRVE